MVPEVVPNVQGESKKLTHSKCLYFAYFIAFLLMSFHSILFLYTREENEWSISSEDAKGAEIFEFSFWEGVLKKFAFKATIILEIVYV